MRIVVLACLWLLVGCTTSSPDLTIAVSSNFLAPAQKIVDSFTERTDITVTIVPGSTGTLTAQIKQGAPYDIFLAADAEHPQLIADAGIGVADSRRTYALGQLVLWSKEANPSQKTVVIRYWDQMARSPWQIPKRPPMAALLNKWCST